MGGIGEVGEGGNTNEMKGSTNQHKYVAKKIEVFFWNFIGKIFACVPIGSLVGSFFPRRGIPFGLFQSRRDSGLP